MQSGLVSDTALSTASGAGGGGGGGALGGLAGAGGLSLSGSSSATATAKARGGDIVFGNIIGNAGNNPGTSQIMLIALAVGAFLLLRKN